MSEEGVRPKEVREIVLEALQEAVWVYKKFRGNDPDLKKTDDRIIFLSITQMLMSATLKS